MTCRFYTGIMIVLTIIMSSSFSFGNQREISTLARSLNSQDPLERTTALKMITSYSSSDDSLFQLINSLLLEELENNFAFNKEDDQRQSYHPAGVSGRVIYVDELSWMCKALAVSGLPIYSSTLKSVCEKASSRSLKKYAKESLKRLSDYEGLNRCAANYKENISSCAAKYICMINSSDATMKKIGAMHIYWSLSPGDNVYRALESQLISFVNNTSTTSGDIADGDDEKVIDKYLLDSMSWMCKALGTSGDPKYRKTLSLIKQNGIRKVATHAKWGLELIDHLGEAYSIMKSVKNDYSDLPSETIKSICMIKSDNLFLQSFGAQHIYWSERTNEAVTDIVAEELLSLNNLCFPGKKVASAAVDKRGDEIKGGKRYKVTRDAINTLIWFSKILGESGNDKYQAALNEVNSNGRVHARLKHLLDRYRK